MITNVFFSVLNFRTNDIDEQIVPDKADDEDIEMFETTEQVLHDEPVQE